MRLFKTGTFVKSDEGDGSSLYWVRWTRKPGTKIPDEFVLCGHGLRRWFDVPCNAKKVSFEIYDRPSKWRIEFKVVPLVEIFSGKEFELEYSDGERVDPQMDELLERFKGGTIYVECYYSE